MPTALQVRLSYHHMHDADGLVIPDWLTYL
jgi:hypothetical protein